MKRPIPLPTAVLVLLATLAMAAPPVPALAEAATWVAPEADFPHDDFGAAARVVAVKRDALLDATIVAFSTGARLIVKPTRFSPGEVTVVASFGAGRSGVPPELVHALWATPLFPLGGTRHLSFEDLDAWEKTSGHPVNVTLVATASAFQLKGEVPSSDLGAELELLTAHAREPGFRPEMTATIASVGPMLAAQIESDPSAAFTRAVQHSLVGARYQELPERADLVATTGVELTALLRPAFATAPDIVIVGDIDVDAAIRAVAATLAAGDVRPSRTSVSPIVATPMKRAQLADLSHAEAPETVRVGIYWRLQGDRSGLGIERAARVAAAMVETRLQQSSLQGVSQLVAPVARAVTPVDLEGANYLGIVVGARGGNASIVPVREMRATKDLAAGRFTDDELAHANQSVAVELGAEAKTNGWWARRLGAVLRDRKSAECLRAGISARPVDRVEIKAFVRRMVGGVAPTVIVGKDAGTGETKGEAQ
ncbi:MAG: hypothetical protein KGL48_12375 [Sphingomonadales bacterium]|nr:hypothetical protein [Sphingomonadales bacterium]MDE2569595.1 hypothetical protein [Sphingomonadales bacterium]